MLNLFFEFNNCFFVGLIGSIEQSRNVNITAERSPDPA